MTVPAASDADRAVAAWDDLCLRLYGEIVTDAVAHTLRHAANEVIGELRAEIGRLKGEIDQMQADHNTILAPARSAQGCMEACRDEEPGTVFRTTDTHREWVLGEDRTWTPR